MNVNILILKGDGLNCENETSFAFRKNGGVAREIHINDLLDSPSTLFDYDIFVIPGGFSFGDDLGAARVLSIKLKHGLEDELRKFISLGRPILGICNGAQALVNLGLLPFGDFKQSMTITQNVPKGFIDNWQELDVSTSRCKWIPQQLKCIHMPIRHGEGRFIFESEEVLDKVIRNGQVVLRYKTTPNSSTYDIAGLTDPTGLVFALMPHPEAAIDLNVLPEGISNSDTNIIFKTIIDYARDCKESGYESSF